MGDEGSLIEQIFELRFGDETRTIRMSDVIQNGFFQVTPLNSIDVVSDSKIDICDRAPLSVSAGNYIEKECLDGDREENFEKLMFHINAARTTGFEPVMLLIGQKEITYDGIYSEDFELTIHFSKKRPL